MTEYIVRVSVEKTFTDEAAALAAWKGLEAKAIGADWRITSSGLVKQ